MIMKRLSYWLPLVLVTTFAIGYYVGHHRDLTAVQTIINYAAETQTTQDGGQALLRHPAIGAITNILVEPGRLSVYGRKGSRIWYYQATK